MLLFSAIFTQKNREKAILSESKKTPLLDICTPEEKDTAMDIDETSPSSSTQEKQLFDHHHQYLTSGKLLNLQLKDPEIRIHFLTQLLIICADLLYNIATLKKDQQPKQQSSSSSKETVIIRSIQTRAIKLLRDAPPNGNEYYENLSFLLSDREVLWKYWKKNKCPPMEKHHATNNKKNEEKETKKMSMTGILPEIPPNPYSAAVISDDKSKLIKISQELSNSLPTTASEYIEDYADALGENCAIISHNLTLYNIKNEYSMTHENPSVVLSRS